MYWKMSIDLTYPLVSSMGQHDPLGVGGLLFDASRIAQLMIKGNLLHAGPDLLDTVVQSALLGMKSFAKGGELEYPADYRLAFRELGLSIGLSAVSNLLQWIEENAPGRFLMI